MHFKGCLKGLKKSLPNRFRGEYLLWSIFLVLSFSFLWSALAGQHGLFSYIQLKKDLKKLEQENKKLVEKNHALQKDIFLLRNDPSRIERVIREEYGYISNGETVYLFNETDPSQKEGTVLKKKNPETRKSP